ncbi:4Fe-4S dicluster domain-containing protein [Mycoplasmatota bacterium]|nr:4Fe-4S dicluster domain-containing protein [Mycoplasmatota bacterium]
MRKFETQVQLIKHKVLKEVAIQTWGDTLFENLLDIPKIINPTKKPISRCCVYKEHAILSERVKLAIGGDLSNKNMIEVIDIACDECPVGGYEVTNGCRGCLAHKCISVCPRNAITLDHNNKAIIDKDKCIECGLCAKVCPYNAIKNNQRPCIKACKVDAIKMDEDRLAVIDNNKCIQCGACVNQCPFGAMMDKSFIINVIDIIKKKSKQKKVYAMVAPSIASQYKKIPVEKVFGALIKLGFDQVVEAALGADQVAQLETEELVEKGFLTSSCCPAFVNYIEKHIPELKENISHNLSPMALLGKTIKTKEKDALVVFIGPCIAKKSEAIKPSVKKYIDAVITFEELDALFDSKNIQVERCDAINIEDASYYGRVFARSGGLIEAIKGVIDEKKYHDFDFSPVTCNGIEECKKALLKHKNNLPIGNFIEGMACLSGCIGGPGSLSHHPADTIAIDNFGKKSSKLTIDDSIKYFQI